MLQLGTDLALYIASNVRTNVRELEGALIRLMAYCSLTGAEISLQTAQQGAQEFHRFPGPQGHDRRHSESGGRASFGLRVTEIKPRATPGRSYFPGRSPCSWPSR